MLLHAAAAVASGAADVVVAYRAVKARSGQRSAGRHWRASDLVSFRIDRHAVVLAYGVLTPASWMSLNAVRYMHAFGVTSEDFGRAVVQFRDYAANNPNAHFYEKPITLEDHQASRWIAEPAIRLFDCCQETDGSVALVITSRRPGRGQRPSPSSSRRPANAGMFEEEIASNHYARDIAVMDGCVALAKRLFDGYGIKRSDIDVAMIYDAFIPDPLHAARGARLLRLRGGQGLHRRREPRPEGQPAVQHQRGTDRRGLHPRTEPDARGRPAAPWNVGKPGGGPETALVCASRTGAILRRA